MTMFHKTNDYVVPTLLSGIRVRKLFVAFISEVCMYVCISEVHTYISSFITERVAEESQIFFRYTHVLPKLKILQT
jgi:hypothetical protein